MKRRVVCITLLLILCFSFVPEARAMATLDHFFNANFGRSYDVYSGPGKDYYRANMGKAMYGGGSARVYGMDGDWIMIGYQLSNGDYRIGYIHKDALKTAKYLEGTIEPLSFDHDIAFADNNCYITDDPIINNKIICSLPENTPIIVLATMGNSWTYVEVKTSQGWMRGFIWSTHLKSDSILVSPAPTSSPMSNLSAESLALKLSTNTPKPTAPWVTKSPVTISHIATAAPLITAQPLATSAPSTSANEWLPTPMTLYLTGNWPVYSGPGEYYYRANKGKATKGEGSCHVYGIENLGYSNWVMIGYYMTSGGYRIGYIRAEALGARFNEVPELKLTYRTRRLNMTAMLTDDPLYTSSAVASLPSGTYVQFLGYVYSSDAVWAYVEALSNNQIMRGFILAGALETEQPY
ncbi:MAG: hypothetical protein IKH30_07535 [Clostridia bacterium]|nr:hypothetical protein [Clostridia bacterium]